MAKSKVNIRRAGIGELMTGSGMKDEIARHTKAVEDACTAESSWGGYASAVSDDGTRVRGKVWSYARQDGRGTTERAKRMIRNLDAQ